ncbi:MAG: imelysin family protein [Myxococcota bacterium]
MFLSRKRSLTTFGIVLLGAGLAFAACGDDDDETPANSNPGGDSGGGDSGGDGDGGGNGGTEDPNDLAQLRLVLETNADIALAAYSDSVSTVEALQTAIDALVAAPSGETLAAAREAWLVAREPYGQTEVYRFRASPIDDTNYDPSDGEDGPEGNINAWPLGEALIDYVVRGDDFGVDELDVSGQSVGLDDGSNIINSEVTIDAALLENTATADDERDVIAGYHAIEFLLWGQDLNMGGNAGEERDNTPGQRPFTDFVNGVGCTNGPDAATDATPCERRGLYLQVATEDLLDNLTTVRDAWADGAPYRTAFTTVDTLDAAKGRLLEILTGMGTLSEGELAGERMQIALSANSQEDEHSCFSDNTHRDIFLNAEGVSNSYFGVYAGYDSTLDGSDDVTTRAVDGYGIDDYLEDIGQTSLATDVAAAFAATTADVTALDATVRGGMPIDVLITNATGEDAAPMRDSIVSLNAQSALIARIATDLDIGDASDVVDPDASECDTTDPTTECGG